MTEIDSEMRSVIQLKIGNISELDAESKFSTVKKIVKLPWRLEVRKSVADGAQSPPLFAFNVWCNWANKSRSWSCKAIVRFLIKLRDLEFVRSFEHTFSANQPFLNWTRLLADLEQQDALEIEAQICVNELIGYGLPPKEDQIFVNGKELDVNKYLLAAHSPFFRAFFFDEFRECRTQTFEINDPEVDVDSFQTMLECIYPDNGRPDDNSVETVLQLCDKYDLSVVKECCERFLIGESRRCMIFKFRMAENYGLTSLKNHCLKSINTIDFCANLLENIAQFTELADRSKQTLSTHLAQLCKTEKTKQNMAAIFQIQNAMSAQQQQGWGGAMGRTAAPSSSHAKNSILDL